MTTPHIEVNFRQGSNEPSELIIGLIGPMGCNRAHVTQTIEQLAKHYGYSAHSISVSQQIEENSKIVDPKGDQYTRVKNLIQAGNELRRRTADNAIMAKLTAAAISKKRPQEGRRNIYIVDSIKRPEEVEEFRHIYGQAFYLIAISSSQTRREEYLRRQCNIGDSRKIDELIRTDRGEATGWGQSTSDAFHRADFFLNEDGNNSRIWNTLERFFDIIFGDPFKTPTFHEYAMYLAYGASMRSADMSRQVGAVVTHGTDVLATGANECPAPGGGTYWPIYDRQSGRISDINSGRDYTRGTDFNAKEKKEMISSLIAGLNDEARGILEENISKSGLTNISEYGRVVHAEMEAILTCARRGIQTASATLFCTTFPCHNCAKHIVASGVRKVVYIEPYPKSKAFEMHSDSLRSPDEREDSRTLFIPFVGVGPRQFVNLFSMTLSAGSRIKRKSPDGISATKWDRASALPRVKVLSRGYMENENTVLSEAMEAISNIDPIEIN